MHDKSVRVPERRRDKTYEPGHTFEHQWSVSEGGYRLRETKGIAQLIEADPSTGRRTYRTNSDAPDAFLEFAGITTPGGVVKFANQYGCLAKVPESVDTWLASASRMKTLIDLWEVVQAGDDALLDKFESLPKSGQGPFSRAIGFVEATISEEVGKDDPKTKFLHVVTFRDEDRRIVEMKWDWCCYPQTLLGAMWCQLADAIKRERTFHSCAVCETLFTANPRMKVKAKQYCSASCRVKASHQRRAQALEMYTLGKSVPEIAKAVGSTTKQVKQWISDKS